MGTETESKPATTKRTIAIRGLDPDLYLEAQIAAKRARKHVYEWLNDLIRKETNKAGK